MNNSLEKAMINSRLLAVRGVIKREFMPKAERLGEDYRPKLDFAGGDVVPLLVLLPTCAMQEKAAVDLAAAMQFAYLAGRVHDLTTVHHSAMSGHAILVGDYLYAFAAIRLANAGYDDWLDKMGRALVRRSEAALVRLGWSKRAYVTKEEQLANLPKEHAELLALAAKLAAKAGGLADEECAAYAEFGFYLGLLHGMEIYGYSLGEAHELAMLKAEEALCALGDMSKLAKRLLLEPLSHNKSAVAPEKLGVITNI